MGVGSKYVSAIVERGLFDETNVIFHQVAKNNILGNL
jgi:hypothetical protein